MQTPNLAAVTCYMCGQSKIDSAGAEHPMIHIAFGGFEATSESTKSMHLDCMPHHVAQARVSAAMTCGPSSRRLPRSAPPTKAHSWPRPSSTSTRFPCPTPPSLPTPWRPDHGCT
jgi:hypothetical protein